MGNYRFSCPYCFEEMWDDEVLFRSERVEREGAADELLGNASSLEELQIINAAEYERILPEYEEVKFFEVKDDPQYNAFWEDFGGTTEKSPLKEKGLATYDAYRVAIIDPHNEEHQQYLERQPQSKDFYWRDEEGMVDSVKLKWMGKLCSDRICKKCHNPLPVDYGKTEVRFAAVIGITGAGKTVYLSQLLKGLKEYAAKVKINANVKTTGAAGNFVENNRIATGEPLPGGTPAKSFQQPLIFKLNQAVNVAEKKEGMFVLYDVAGEVFTDTHLVDKFAPFIQHADGIIVLIDPLQFNKFASVNIEGKQLDDPTSALDAIQHVLTGDRNTKSETPIALCLSKADRPEVQQVLEVDLKKLLSQKVSPVTGPNGQILDQFNAQEYAPIAEKLTAFLNQDEYVLGVHMDSLFSFYSFFAVTALGCNVEDNGRGEQVPAGTISPRRIEEPLLWLFYKLGYIGKNGSIPGERYCPLCGSLRTITLPDGSFREERKLFKKMQIPVEFECLDCGHQWNSQEE